MARSTPAVSVLKKGLPVPPARSTTRPLSRCSRAVRRAKGSAIWVMRMAESTRAGTWQRDSASCMASELITVASIPMWSPVTRSTPCRLPVLPRKMLPPPMTKPTCTPWAHRSRTSAAMASSRPRSMPLPLGPPRTSPLSLRRMRRYLSPIPAVDRRGTPRPLEFLAQLEAREAAQRDVLAELGDRRLDALLDAHVGVLDECLLQEHALLVELLDPPLHHLLDDRG